MTLLRHRGYHHTNRKTVQNCSTQEVCRFTHMFPRIGKMGSSQSLDSWLIVQNDIQQCGMEFYVLTTLDW